MASHLTVTTAANPGVAVKGLNAQASATAPASDVFAALLGGNAPVEATNELVKTATVALAAGGLVDLALGQDGGTGEKPDETPDPVAVPIDAVVPIQQPVSPQALLTGIIDGLTALRTVAQNGQVPSADDLAKLNKSLEALAGALGLPLDDLPSMDDLAAMAAKPLAPGATLEDQLIATLAPMTQGVLADATKTAATDPATADQLKAIGDKLASLLKGLNGGAVNLDAMAGNNEKAPLGPELQAALDRLLKPAATTIATAKEPVFIPPKLQITEPVLAGKPADAVTAKPAEGTTLATTTTTTPSTTPSTTPEPALKQDASTPSASDAANQPDKPKDTKLDAVVTATAKAADTQPEAPTAVQAAIHATTRVEAMPGPRPVIAGYQTSQQQLNLPQIAFELVRQVNDGNSRFQMRLDPPELGKIDVRLDIDRSGQVTARLTVEKAETLDLMQRDQRGLEKALQQAGLDSSKTNLEFSLKQNPFSGQQGQDQGGRQPAFGGDTMAEAEEPPAPQINLYRASLSASGVNIIA